MIKNKVTTAETQDLGSAIQGLISANINALETSFLAQVESIAENRVNIKPLLKNDTQESDVIISNALIAQPQSGEYKISFKVKAGDIGLAIVSKQDISTYKNNGTGGLVNTQRKFDITDSIFIPLSLYLQEPNDSLGLTISNADSSVKLELKDDTLTIEAPNLKIESSSVSIKASDPLEIGTGDTLKSCFEAIIDNLQTAIVGGITSGSPTTQTITQLPNMSMATTQMKQTIAKVLK